MTQSNDAELSFDADSDAGIALELLALGLPATAGSIL
jgi:hypothetical protein